MTNMTLLILTTFCPVVSASSVDNNMKQAVGSRGRKRTPDVHTSSSSTNESSQKSIDDANQAASGQRSSSRRVSQSNDI